MKISDIMPKKEILNHKDAQTVEEIMTETGLHKTAVRDFINNLRKNGKLKEGYKKTGNRLTHVYMVVK
jgi:predicted transcriptional regulator